MKPVYILEGKRIPTGRFGGAYKDSSAVDLGAQLIEKLIDYVLISRSDIEGVYIGNVVSSGLGQHPANQIKIRAGLRHATDASNFSKVCSSSFLSAEYGYLKIATGDMDAVIVGGIESMSNAPFLMRRLHGVYDPLTFAYTFSYLQTALQEKNADPLMGQYAVDSLQSEGLCDALYPGFPVMGKLAESIIRDHEISRDVLDAYAFESYSRAGSAREKISRQLLHIKNSPQFDEGWREPDRDKIRSRPPVFCDNGRLTVANSSQLSDGASALILISEKQAVGCIKKPMARIVAFGHAGLEPREFLRAPTLAITRVVEKAKLRLQDIDLFEINEAFPPAPLFAIKELGLSPEKVNVWGGAIANGHPLGASGAKILVNLCYALQDMNGRYGIATTCHGGGGAVAVLIENCN
ncbi:MAG: thiolase family protein [bacterium]|nr:thiolase family protein [bacterium]